MQILNWFAYLIEQIQNLLGIERSAGRQRQTSSQMIDQRLFAQLSQYQKLLRRIVLFLLACSANEIDYVRMISNFFLQIK